jgi:hypothetical protein
MVATEAWRSKNQLIGFVAQMSGMTKGKDPFHRHCLVMRERNAEEPQPANGGPQDRRESMIRETGLFTLDELKGRHREAIDTLAGLIPTPLFIDPIFEHSKRRARAQKDAELASDGV